MGTFLFLLMLAHGADLSTTEFGLRHNPNLREMRPFAQTTQARVLIKTGAMIGEPFLIKGLNGHPKTQRWMKILMIAAPSAAAINNAIRTPR